MASKNYDPRVKKILLGLSAYYGHDIPEEQLKIWQHVLDDTDPAAIQKIATELLRDPSITKMPSAAKLREYARAGRVFPDDADTGNEVAGRIWEAVGKFGEQGESRAREWLGELAWEVVKRTGGWFNLCHLQTHERGTFFAQVRDQVETIAKMARGGSLNQATPLPAPTNAKVKALIGKSTRTMGGSSAEG